MLFEPPALDARELEVIAEIESLRESLRTRLRDPRRWTGSLRRTQFARAVQGSNSIEGYNATLDDAVAIAVGEEPLDADQETALAIKGYRDAMTYVLQLSGEPRFHFSEQILKSLHFMMTSYDLKNRPGLWRVGSIYVQQEDTGAIVYEGVDVEQIDPLIDELVSRLEADEGQSVVKAAMAHLNLVLIHPFRDGNGRMARCLQTLVLARDGFVAPQFSDGIVAPQFSSIEEYLGRNTRAYYDVLAQVGTGSWSPSNDTRPWIRFVLAAHLRQATTVLRRSREIERTYVELDRLVSQHAFPERVVDALFDAVMGWRVRRAVYKAIVNGQSAEPISDQTATRDLQALANADLLIPKGERRGRFYVAGPVLQEIRHLIRQSRSAQDETDPFTIPAT